MCSAQHASISADAPRRLNAELEEAVLHSGMADAMKGARDALVIATKCAPPRLAFITAVGFAEHMLTAPASQRRDKEKLEDIIDDTKVRRERTQATSSWASDSSHPERGEVTGQRSAACRQESRRASLPLSVCPFSPRRGKTARERAGGKQESGREETKKERAGRKQQSGREESRELSGRKQERAQEEATARADRNQESGPAESRRAGGEKTRAGGRGESKRASPTMSAPSLRQDRQSGPPL